MTAAAPVDRLGEALRDANEYAALSDPRQGPGRLADFQRAPQVIQEAYLARVREKAERDRAGELDFFAREGFWHPRYGCRLLFWDQRWSRRAKRYREAEAGGRLGAKISFERERDRLLDIEAEEYVPILTDTELRGHSATCPLPDHEDRSPSFWARGTGWACYGCGRHGSIYELAGLLWGLRREGSDFLAIHRELRKLFP